jgi:hypothetical protein
VPSLVRRSSRVQYLALPVTQSPIEAPEPLARL